MNIASMRIAVKGVAPRLNRNAISVIVGNMREGTKVPVPTNLLEVREFVLEYLEDCKAEDEKQHARLYKKHPNLRMDVIDAMNEWADELAFEARAS